MIIGTFKIEDLNKLIKTVSLSKSLSIFKLSQERNGLTFSYIGDDGKEIQITIFESNTSMLPLITKVDYL